MMFLSQRSGCTARLAGGLIALTCVFGCASPGTPRAPSLRLPATVKKLNVERHGNNVVVRFTTPERTTDDQPITTPVTATLCRAVGDGPCGPTSSFPGKVKIAGPVEWVDVLPQGLVVGTPRRLTYRVELFNADGHSAGAVRCRCLWRRARLRMRWKRCRLRGRMPGLCCGGRRRRRLRGEVLVKREDLHAAPPKPAPVKKAEPATKGVGGRKVHSAGPAKASVGASKDESTVWLHAADGAKDSDSGGLVDATAKADEPYRYTAVRRRIVTLDGHDLEMWSEASKGTEITLTDVFPPGVPQGLVVAGFPVRRCGHAGGGPGVAAGCGERSGWV